jgi:O-antigen/teichoic acid export membrane protein
MDIELLSAIATINEYTGFERTRVIGLLTVLAFISVAMWAVVVVSIVIRQCAVVVIRLIRYSRKRHYSLLKYPRSDHGA